MVTGFIRIPDIHSWVATSYRTGSGSDQVRDSTEKIRYV